MIKGFVKLRNIDDSDSYNFLIQIGRFDLSEILRRSEDYYKWYGQHRIIFYEDHEKYKEYVGLLDCWDICDGEEHINVIIGHLGISLFGLKFDQCK